MARAYPLAGPDGTTRWWACGVCHYVGSCGAQGRLWRERDAQWSQDQAQKCCTCRRCEAETGPGAAMLLCAVHEAAWKAQCAEREAQIAREAEAASAAVEASEETERWAFLLGVPPVSPEPRADGQGDGGDQREFVEVAVTEIIAGIFVYAACVVDGRGYSYESRGDDDYVVAQLQGIVAQGTGRLVTPLTPAMRVRWLEWSKQTEASDGTE